MTPCCKRVERTFSQKCEDVPPKKLQTLLL
jgi:hypothetical protein